MKYSVCIDAVFMNKCTVVEAMETVKKAGYSAIEFWSWWDKGIEKIAAKKEELGLEVSAFCTRFVNPGDFSRQQEYLQGLQETLRTAQSLHCPTVIVQAGWEFDSFQKGITRKEHRQCLTDTMKKAGKLAEEAGITLVLEPLNLLVDHPGYHLSSSQDAAELIEKIGSPNVKLLFDIYHQQITEGNLLRNISAYIDKIGHFHAAGNPGRSEITEGEIHYHHIFEEIKKLGYTGYIGLEYMTDQNPLPGLIEAREQILA